MLLCVLVCLLAVSSQAQVDPGPDGIGIYADLGGTVNNMFTSPGSVELYVLVTNVQAPLGVGSWELSVDVVGPATYVGYVIPYEHIQVGVFPSFSVGAAQDIRPPAPAILLMSLFFEITGPEPVDFYIKEAHLPVGGSLGNYLPVYINGDIHEDLRNLYPSSGSIDLPVFRINGEAPVATVSARFGDIKALYR